MKCLYELLGKDIFNKDVNGDFIELFYVIIFLEKF